METENELGTTPLSHEDQKKLDNAPKNGYKEHLGLFEYDNITTEFATDGQPTKTTKEHQRGKTFWDWMQLLLIPLLLAMGGYWLNSQQEQRSQQTSKKQHDTDLQIAKDQQEEKALQTYLDRMSDLLLNNKLHESPDQEVDNIATARTITVIPQLNDKRRGELIMFLHGANLINKDHLIIDLRGFEIPDIDLERAMLDHSDLSHIDMTHANLKSAYLVNANLDSTTLKYADLSCHVPSRRQHCADLSNANLSNVDLEYANMSRVNLSNADLSNADLTGAIGTTPDQLGKAKSLKGATMPNGSKHP